MLNVLVFGFDEPGSRVGSVALPFASLAARRRARAASSDGKSFVSNLEQVSDSNCRIAVPSRFVECSSESIVVSVWSRSFASPCHVANSNRSSRIILL